VPVPPTRFSRRGALRAAGLLTVGSVAGCGPFGPAAQVPAAAADPLEPLIRRAQSLVGAYEATLRAHPALGPRLNPVRDSHRRHVDALLEVLDVRRRALLDVPVAAGTAPPGRAAALAALRTAEHVAVAEARQACLDTGDGARAALLGSISAAGSCHLVVL
jgi:hypothetical protein